MMMMMMMMIIIIIIIIIIHTRARKHANAQTYMYSITGLFSSIYSRVEGYVPFLHIIYSKLVGRGVLASRCYTESIAFLAASHALSYIAASQTTRITMGMYNLLSSWFDCPFTTALAPKNIL
jgi:hypothetical protein